MSQTEEGGEPPVFNFVPLHPDTSAYVPPSSMPIPMPAQSPFASRNIENHLDDDVDGKHRSDAEGHAAEGLTSAPRVSDGSATARSAGDRTKDTHSMKDVDPHIWLERVLIAERNAMNAAMQERHLRLLEHFEVVISHHKERVLSEAAKPDEQHNPLVTAAIERSQKLGVQSRTTSEDVVHDVGQRSTVLALMEGSLPVHRISSVRRSMSRAMETLRAKSRNFDMVERTSNAIKELRGNTWSETFQNLVKSNVFELFFGFLIIANTALMAVERQYHGMDTAFLLSYKNTTLTAGDEWPGAKSALDIAENTFGILFTIEVLAKFIALRWRFFYSWWNWFDSFVVVLWLVDRNRVGLPMNPLILRLARIARLLRLLRVVRWITIFDPLHLIVKAVVSSVSVLMWSIIVLVLLMVAVAMVAGQFVEAFIRDENQTMSARVAVFESWGTFTRSMVTMFEISLANWAPQCRLLMDEVSESWALFFLVYKCSIGFAVIQVITAVFIQQTFKVAARDEEVMIAEKKAATNAMFRNLGNLFQCLDLSGDGFLTVEEFQEVLEDNRVQTWFTAIEVHAQDVTELFHLLDDGDGMISRDEFIRGVKSIKGNARSSDVLVLLNKVRSMTRYLGELDNKIDRMKNFLFPAEAEADAEVVGASRSIKLDPISPRQHAPVVPEAQH